MSTISAGILTLLVIASISIRVESFPDGCAKMIGSPADGIPGELEVKVKPNIRSDAIVKIMLELTTSVCEGKLWRSSNTDNAVMEAITCSDLSYVEGLGFDASDMSDAAVMWVSEQSRRTWT